MIAAARPFRQVCQFRGTIADLPESSDAVLCPTDDAASERPDPVEHSAGSGHSSNP